MAAAAAPFQASAAAGGPRGASDTARLPAENREYKTVEYWDGRFENEAAYEWLCGFSGVGALLMPFLSVAAPRVLVVGCGNSSFSEELARSVGAPESGARVVSIDFSATVIEAMRRRSPQLEWEVMDMTALTFPDASFDLVIDKAAMDALVTDEGDPWDPNAETRASCAAMVSSVQRVLRPGGRFLMISFQQPHFRKRYLTHPALSPPKVQGIEVGMGYFFFSMQKL
jgi:SAM-dependent methyltransferase